MSQASQKPLVSVILPTYNRSQRLPASILSVLKQSFQDYELIIIDDGSTDRTEAVVKQIADPRIKYFKKENGGPASARNWGMARACGQYLALLDDDDLWLKDHLENAVEHLNGHKECGMVYSKALEVNEEGDRTGSFGERYDKKLHEVKFIIATPTVVFRAECLQRIGGFVEDPVLRTGGGEDWDFFLRLSDDFRIDFIDHFSVIVVRHLKGFMQAAYSNLKVFDGFGQLIIKRTKSRPAPFDGYYTSILRTCLGIAGIASILSKEPIAAILKDRVLPIFAALQKIDPHSLELNLLLGNIYHRIQDRQHFNAIAEDIKKYWERELGSSQTDDAALLVSTLKLFKDYYLNSHDPAAANLIDGKIKRTLAAYVYKDKFPKFVDIELPIKTEILEQLLLETQKFKPRRIRFLARTDLGPMPGLEQKYQTELHLVVDSPLLLKPGSDAWQDREFKLLRIEIRPADQDRGEVIDAISRLLKKENSGKPKNRVISIQYVFDDQAPPETKALLLRWKGHLGPDQYVSVKAKKRKMFDNPMQINGPCQRLWENAFISNDGTVSFCELDQAKELKIGNITNNSLEQIWNGKAANDLRAAMLQGSAAAFRACASCRENKLRVVNVFPINADFDLL